MKTKLLALATAALITAASSAHAQILPGDIAIIQVNNAADGFTWVALKDIAAPATWTDSSWGFTSGTGFRTTENTSSTLPATISAGTIGFVDVGSGFNNGGEQVFLYNNTGSNFTTNVTATQAQLVFGINWDNSGWITSGVPSTSTSYQPNTLLNSSLTLSSGDNWYYNGTTSGTATSLLAAITDSTNWISSIETDKQFSDFRPSVTAFTISPDLVAVPEPSTYGLFAGLLVFGFIALRRRLNKNAQS